MRRTFLADNGHDCGEELEVVVERGVMWDEADFDKQFKAHYRLVSWPSTCKCGRPIPLWEPTQDELMAAYALPESEEV